LAKFEVEKYCIQNDIEIVRPGLILESERYSKKVSRIGIVPSGRSTVYVTHVNCVVEEILNRIDGGKIPSGNLACTSIRLSELRGENSRCISLPDFITKVFFLISPRTRFIEDMKDAYLSLKSTPRIVLTRCIFE
jgi:hypothetical protein